jgi:hypothetical protein
MHKKEVALVLHMTHGWFSVIIEIVSDLIIIDRKQHCFVIIMGCLM